MFRDEKSLEAIASEFRRCVADDAFVDEEGRAYGEFASLREYIRALCNIPPNHRGGNSALPSSHADLSDLSQTLAEVTEKSISTAAGDAVRVGSLLRSLFCEVGVQYFTNMLLHTAQDRAPELCAEAGAADLVQWEEWVLQEDRFNAYADALYELLMLGRGSMPLVDFFVAREFLGHFPGWTDPTYFDESPALHVGSAYLGNCSVAVRVAKPTRSTFQTLAELGSSVLGYKWEATLSTQASVEGYVSGVIYVFDRVDGVPDASRAQLLMAAGVLSDNEIKHVQVMLDQHQDADELISKGDLCFIQHWERKPSSEKGLGAQCLIVAMNELRTKFHKLSNAIFDVRPSQFLSWEAVVEPPAIAVAKQGAIEAVTGYLASLDLARWNVRHTFSNVRWDQMSAIMAIGGQTVLEGMKSINKAAEQEEERRNEGGVGRPALVFEGHEDELVDLFSQAGMGELATQIDDEVAIDGEIELALKELVFGQRIHYLPLTISSGFSEEFLTIEYEDVDEELAERIDDFDGALPPELEISRVFSYGTQIEPSDMVTECVIEVKAETPFGTMFEFFTLVPRPRPFNVTWWIEKNYMP